MCTGAFTVDLTSLILPTVRPSYEGFLFSNTNLQSVFQERETRCYRCILPWGLCPVLLTVQLLSELVKSVVWSPTLAEFCCFTSAVLLTAFTRTEFAQVLLLVIFVCYGLIIPICRFLIDSLFEVCTSSEIQNRSDLYTTSRPFRIIHAVATAHRVKQTPSLMQTGSQW